MSARIIWDHEIKSIKEAAGVLLTGENAHGLDPRDAFHEIMAVLGNVELRGEAPV